MRLREDTGLIEQAQYEQFTMEVLKHILSKAKSRKPPGPDLIPIKVIKGMSEYNRYSYLVGASHPHLTSGGSHECGKCLR